LHYCGIALLIGHRGHREHRDGSEQDVEQKR